MTNESTIAFASNRGPIMFVEDGDGFQTKRGAGGLASALDSVARRLGDAAVWVAAAASDADRHAIERRAIEAVHEELGYRFYLLDIDPKTYARYYDNISNRMLWFANHCLWDEVEVEGFDRASEDWEEAYEPVNERFATTLADALGPNPLVLFQDYHLSTAPAYLRDRRDDATILHFTHTSFCRPEGGLGRLPGRISDRVIKGMSAADLIGLHVSRWCRNFADSCAEAGATIDRSTGSMSHDGMTSWIRSYPIPIDAGDLIERASSDGARKWAREFREWAGGGRLLARVDRSEPSKNIVRGFEAFGALLDRRPELADEIRFVACVYPSRQTMPEYRRYSEQIQSAVDRVLERHPGSIKLYSDDDFDRSLGALLAYDALLVNPLMDGMNLVSKEGPTLNQQDGVLILSSGAGSFEELGDSAVEITDPLDVGQTSMAIEKALEMPAPERKERAQELREAATARTPEDWIEAQLADLRSISDTGEPISPAPAL